MLELAEFGWVVGVVGEAVQLGLRKTHPLTEGDVQGNSVFAVVQLGRPQVGKLAQPAV